MSLGTYCDVQQMLQRTMRTHRLSAESKLLLLALAEGADEDNIVHFNDISRYGAKNGLLPGDSAYAAIKLIGSEFIEQVEPQVEGYRFAYKIRTDLG